MDEAKTNRQDNTPIKGAHQPKLQQQEQLNRTRWTSNSKFNRILGNIERSIFGQSQNNQNIDNKSSNSSAKHKKASQQSGKTKTQTDVKGDTNQQQMQEEARQLACSKGNVTSPSLSQRMNATKTSEQASGKLTLNKFQHQLAATLRPNQHIVKNKLSIPPPHANGEARSHNHSLLFGNGGGSGASALDVNRSLFDPSKATNLEVNHSAPKTASTMNRVAQNKNGKLIEDHIIRLNTSPASSAKSLPAIASNSGSQLLKQSSNIINSNKDDDESGFSTYQSRRSLLANISQQQQNSSIAPSSTGEQGATNMILVHANQMPIGAVNYCNNFSNGNFTPHPQQYVYNYHQANYPINNNNTQQQHQTNTHPSAASNQVPIISTVNPSNNNHYTNNQHMHLPHMALTNHQPQLHRQAPNQSYNDHQILNLYRSYPSGSVDNNQQIYANAPPKPRRYQYYDTGANQHRVMMPQRVLPMATNSSIVTASMPNNHFVPNQQALYTQQQVQPQMTQQYHRPQQLSLTNQPFSNLSYLSVPSLYQTNEELSRLNQRPQNVKDFNRIQHKQPEFLPPHTLVKSKSSLDAGDLMRLRQNKQLDSQTGTNTLRFQYQQQPIYGARLDNFNMKLSQSQQQAGSSQMPIQFSSNLQRSKSVTHLLPEYGENHNQTSLANMSHLGNGCMQVTTAPKFLSLSSNSTTNLNLTGVSSNRAPTLTNQNHSSDLARHRSSHNLNSTQQYTGPTNQFQPANQLFSTSSLVQPKQQRIQHQTQLNECSDISNNFMTASSQQNKAKPMMPTSNNSVLSNRLVRHSPGDNLVAQADGFAKQSLDDKIRHLLIGNSDNSNESCTTLRTGASITGRGLNQNDHDNNVIYHTSNNAIFLSSLQAKNAAQATSRQQLQQASVPNNLATNALFKRDQSAGAISNSSPPRVVFNEPQGNTKPLIEANCGPSFDDISKMGNRQHRQYNVSKQAFEPSIGVDTRRLSDAANSHLIVDLTTPRVLAKTQTNLLAVSSRTNPISTRDSWSINQSGLPQVAPNTSVTSINQSAPDVVDPTRKQSMVDVNATNKNQSSSNKHESETKSVICERTAPYYYSDLKSEEQRQALLSIVQQKSLSPPPQLLSRSTDQSSTRLTPKSATSHPNHVRILNESVAQRQNSAVDGIKQRSKQGLLNNQPINDFSSTSNIAKNIDKLFESPVSQIPAVQSMSALNNCKEGDSNRHSLCQTINLESMSSGYFSSEIKGRNFSKSKSLDNISQKSSVSDAGLINPVYENIRRSDKLMNAIKNSASSFSDTNATTKHLNSANTNSDESMDSILGSSLDDSDSSSDIINEIKISSTDNHLADISQLIDQLKSNHSKLTEEYKSTLLKISKTINTKSKQVSGDQKNETLARRLQLLELKSKKCESRSKNQLALIQMMEKVLRQSKLRASSNRSQLSNSGSSPPSLDEDAAAANLNSPTSQPVNRDRRSSSPCFSEHFDYKNVQKTANSPNTALVGDKSQQKSNDCSKPPDVGRNNNYTVKQIVNGGCSQPSQEIIKAIVVEKKTCAELVKASTPPEELTTNPTKISPNQLTNGSSRTKDGSKKDNAVTKRIQDIEMRNNRQEQQRQAKKNRLNNPFSDSFNDDSDNSITSCDNDASESEQSMADKPLSKINEASDSVKNDNISSNLMRDDDDFIEFLSSSSHRSQFEASQFSASDFNTSTSASESSTSGAGNDSLNSLIEPKNCGKNKGNKHTNKLFKTSSETTVGILKNRRGGYINMSPPGASEQSYQQQQHDEVDRVNKGKFNDVFGNVIDVDVCPLNNLSRGSPVDAKAPCLN